MTSGLTRREFLIGLPIELAAAYLVVKGINKDKSTLAGFEGEPGIYQLPDGKVPLVSYQVVDGDDIGSISDTYNTYYDLIVHINNLELTHGIHPGQIVRIPANAKDPLSYIPEVGIIRHKLSQGDTAQSIALMYGVPREVIDRSLADYKNLIYSGNSSILSIRGADASPIGVGINVEYDTKDRLSESVSKSLVNRILHTYLFYTGGDKKIFRYITKGGIRIGYGAPGFQPPDRVQYHADAIAMEKVALQQLGHELWHLLPFPWWSAGSDEGTAGYAASEWATRSHAEYPIDDTVRLWYSDWYYNGVNNPSLRSRKFNQKPVENRILATRAWQRIEMKYPGIIAFLLLSAVHHYDNNATIEPNIPFSLYLIQTWIEKEYGPASWDYINSQHILFTQ